MSPLQGVGPVISALPESPEITAIYSAFELGAVKPKVFPFASENRVLETLSKLPDPEAADPLLPEVVALVHETPNVDPAYGFSSFARGVACVALIVPSDAHEAISGMLLQVATRLSDSGDLPALALDFKDEIQAAELAIFRNGEPMTYHSQLAFMQGAFWLLGFIKHPRKRRGGGLSPVQWVARMQARWASLGVLP
jgi:hypothetical protein